MSVDRQLTDLVDVLVLVLLFGWLPQAVQDKVTPASTPTPAHLHTGTLAHQYTHTCLLYTSDAADE